MFSSLLTFFPIFSFICLLLSLSTFVLTIFYVVYVFLSTLISILEIVNNKICDRANFSPFSLHLIYVSIIFVMINKPLFFTSFFYLSISFLFICFKELSFKSPGFLTFCCVEWMSELLSKTNSKSQLVLWNLRILVLFCSKQYFIY